ncbi:MAG: helix-turn-helix transcriptional regulator [Treponema sp.]|nr:helix-turn-helix transcriptional regulator [Treponema sp.]MDE6705709.1 helix-turn-helix domain-containing protein [Treponemataceae bacterium]
MTNIQSCLSKNMKLHRRRLGLSQAALAEKAGTAPNYIALIEVGKSFPSLPMLEKIAAALQIDALDLFDKDGMISIDKDTLRADVLGRISQAVNDAFGAHSICP